DDDNQADSGDQPGDQPGEGGGDQEGEGQPQPGQGKPGRSTGTVLDAPPESTGGAGDGEGGQASGQPVPMTEEDVKGAREEARMVCRKAGTLPAGAARLAKEAQDSQEDWRSIMHEFIDHQAPTDFTWAKPNRRFLAQGIFLPGMKKENLGTVVWLTDTSASI